jgi:hypothetical protein
MKKIIPTEVLDLGERQIQFTISSEVQDRDEDIMVAAGCDFKNYAKNPQFLGFHDYSDFPLGKPVSWWIDPLEKKVKAVVYFPTIEELTGNTPQNASEKVKLVDTTYYFYKNKLLNAVSIGFKTIDSSPNPESKSGWGSIVSKWELLEFSACPVPANQDALVEACKSYDPSGGMAKIFEEGRNVTNDKSADQGGTKSGARLSADSLAAVDEIEKCYKAIKSKATKVSALHDEMKGHLDEMDELHGKMKTAIKKLRDGPAAGDSTPPAPATGETGDDEALNIEDED